MSVSKLRSVEADPSDPTSRLILLRYTSEAELPQPFLSFISPYSKGFLQYPITLKYDHWNATEILHAVLPEELLDDSPTSFTQTGHIGECLRSGQD
jgi:tRNA (guanine37-N1)-methyltransferase